MSDVYGEECFSPPQNVYKWAKHGFTTIILNQKDSWCSANTLSDKEKIKKVMLIVFWDREWPIPIDFLEKGVTVYSCTFCYSLGKNSLNLLNDLCVCVHIQWHA